MFDLFGLGDSSQDTVEEVVQEATPGGTVNFKFERFEGNPIISPDQNISWMAYATYSPAAIYLDGYTHLLFRAQGYDKVSTFGYAMSKDGYHIDELVREPVYVPREEFERPTISGWNSGCEDPRITKIDDTLYVTYTAYDGTNPPRVALTSIKESDFLARKWNWSQAKLISPPGVDDKDACIVKMSKGDGYIAFHRLGNAMWMDKLKNLEFPDVKYLSGEIIAQARIDSWDNVKIGIAAPPLFTPHGWVLLYHAVSNPGFAYKIGAMLLDSSDPKKIVARSSQPLLEPEMLYETQGQVQNVVFGCGAVVRENTIFLYYGGGDSVVCVATIPLSNLLATLGI